MPMPMHNQLETSAKSAINLDNDGYDESVGTARPCFLGGSRILDAVLKHAIRGA